MNFDLRELEIFCAVVEQQSFTRAAEKVHLAQASVSERIASWRTSIGAELLHRSTRKVTPTAVGRRLYEGAKRLLAERQCVANDLADLLGVQERRSGRSAPARFPASTCCRNTSRRSGPPTRRFGFEFTSRAAKASRQGWRAVSSRSASSARGSTNRVCRRRRSGETSWSWQYRQTIGGSDRTDHQARGAPRQNRSFFENRAPAPGGPSKTPFRQARTRPVSVHSTSPPSSAA